MTKSKIIALSVPPIDFVNTENKRRNGNSVEGLKFATMERSRKVASIALIVVSMANSSTYAYFVVVPQLVNMENK